MPLPLLLVFLSAGLLLENFYVPGQPYLLAGCAALLFATALFLPSRWRFLPAGIAALLLGISLVALAARPPLDSNALHRFVGPEPIAVTGEVGFVGRSVRGNPFYDLQVEKLVNRGVEIPVVGKLRLYVEARDMSYVVGDRIVFMSRLRRPRLFGTPGEFNFVRYLARRGIHTLAYVRQPDAIARLADRRDASVLEAWRSVNVELIERSVHERSELGGLVRALAQGERHDVSVSQRELLAFSGLSHLFAISGLHFGLVSAALYLGCAWLWRRSTWLLEQCPPRRALPLLLVPLLYGYLCFSGGAISSWRAFLMLAAAALVMASLRRVDPLRVLAAVAMILLLGDPLLIYEAGFQLSFSATFGILLAMRSCYPWLSKRVLWQRYPLLIGLTTLTATLSTLPFVLLHFQQWSPAGLLANLFAVPLVSFVLLPLALLGALLGPFWPLAAQGCFGCCAWLLEGLLWSVERLLNWPGMAPYVFFPTPATWMWLCLLALAGIWLIAGPRRWLLPVMIGGVGLLLPWGEPPAVALTALSVGQGEALLLSFEGRRHVLVDGGGLPGSRFDVGSRLVVPALAQLGVDHLEAVILTHEHPDHMLGVPAVLERLSCNSLWTSVSPEQFPESLRRRLDRGGVTLHAPSRGWQTLDVAGSQLHLFAPGGNAAANNRSLVVYVRHAEQGILLCGDLERSGVERLLDDPPVGPVTLLKLPHHGSRHSAQQSLLEEFSPSTALVSAGFGNRYRLPHPETVALYEHALVPLWRTDVQGTLQFVPEGGGWRVTRWKEGAFR